MGRGVGSRRESGIGRPLQWGILAVVTLWGFAVAPPVRAQQPPQTVEECVAFAIANQPSLKAAQATVEASNQQVWQQVSNYLPQVNGNYNANRRKTSPTASTGADFAAAARTFSFYSTGLSLTQVLFDFGQNLNLIQAAIATEDSLIANSATQREDVVFNVKQAYFNTLAAARLLHVADETIRQNQQHVEQAQGRFDVGFAPKFDVTQANVQLAQAQLNQVAARSNVKIAKATLGNAMGLTGPPPFDLVDTFDAPLVYMSETEALQRAYDHRPELQSFLAQQRSLELQISALKKDYLPFVSGGANYIWAGTNYPLQDNWNVGAAVNLSIFNGGLTTAQIGQAKADLANIQFNTEVERQNIALQVQQALYNLQEAAESIVAAEKVLDQARENLALADGRYATGAGNIIEVTDAQTSLTTSEARLVQATYNYKIAVAQLERAMAQSLEQ